MEGRPQEVSEANVAGEAQAPNQGPHVMTMAEVQLAAVLVEEEEVLVADDQASAAKTMTTMMMILIKGEGQTQYRSLSGQ